MQYRNSDNYTKQNSRSYYSYGSTARKLQPVREPRELSERGPQRKSNVQRKTNPQRRVNPQHNVRPAQKPQEAMVVSGAESMGLIIFKYILVVVLICTGCLMYMGVSAQVDNASMQLRQEKSNYDTLKSANDLVEAEMSEQLDMDYIRTEAINRLGMIEPESYQVIYIDVPIDSHTVQYAGSEYFEEEDTGLFSLIF